jgi:hypothetical protein
VCDLFNLSKRSLRAASPSSLLEMSESWGLESYLVLLKESVIEVPWGSETAFNKRLLGE